CGELPPPHPVRAAGSQRRPETKPASLTPADAPGGRPSVAETVHTHPAESAGAALMKPPPEFSTRRCGELRPRALSSWRMENSILPSPPPRKRTFLLRRRGGLFYFTVTEEAETTKAAPLGERLSA